MLLSAGCHGSGPKTHSPVPDGCLPPCLQRLVETCIPLGPSQCSEAILCPHDESQIICWNDGAQLVEKMGISTITDPAGNVCFSVVRAEGSIGDEGLLRWTDAHGVEVAREVFDITYGLCVTCADDGYQYSASGDLPKAECKPWLALATGFPDSAYLGCERLGDQGCEAVRACGVGGVNAGRDAAADSRK